MTVLCTPAAAPRMKPYLERVFRIMATTPMPRLTGRMVSNIIARGDQAPERAALNADDVCTAMRRWIVAVHDRLPQGGLGSERAAYGRKRPMAYVGD